MKLKTVNIKPDFVGDVNISKCIPGKIYNIYKCLKCVLEHEKDKLRENRVKVIGYNKKGFGIYKTVCKHKKTILIKYKKCLCKIEFWGDNIIASKTCKHCNPYLQRERDKPKKYYRLKLFCFNSYIDLNDLTKWDCINRGYCLESTFIKGSKKGIACKNCNFYSKGF